MKSASSFHAVNKRVMASSPLPASVVIKSRFFASSSARIAWTMVWRAFSPGVAARASGSSQHATMKRIMRERGFTSMAFIAGILPTHEKGGPDLGPPLKNMSGCPDMPGVKPDLKCSVVACAGGLELTLEPRFAVDVVEALQDLELTIGLRFTDVDIL